MRAQGDWGLAALDPSHASPLVPRLCVNALVAKLRFAPPVAGTQHCRLDRDPALFRPRLGRIHPVEGAGSRPTSFSIFPSASAATPAIPARTGKSTAAPGARHRAAARLAPAPSAISLKRARTLAARTLFAGGASPSVFGPATGMSARAELC